MHYIMSFLKKNSKKSKKWDLASIHTTLKEKIKIKLHSSIHPHDIVENIYIIIIIIFFK